MHDNRWRTLAQCAICARARRQAAHELKATFALPPQDAHLMPKGDELKFQGGTTSNTEGEQGNEGRKNRDHAHDGMARTQRSLFFSTDWNFEQAQGGGWSEWTQSSSFLWLLASSRS